MVFRLAARAVLVLGLQRGDAILFNQDHVGMRTQNHTAACMPAALNHSLDIQPLRRIFLQRYLQDLLFQQRLGFFQLPVCHAVEDFQLFIRTTNDGAQQSRDVNACPPCAGNADSQGVFYDIAAEIELDVLRRPLQLLCRNGYRISHGDRLGTPLGRGYFLLQHFNHFVHCYPLVFLYFGFGGSPAFFRLYFLFYQTKRLLSKASFGLQSGFIRNLFLFRPGRYKSGKQRSG